MLGNCIKVQEQTVYYCLSRQSLPLIRKEKDLKITLKHVVKDFINKKKVILMAPALRFRLR